MTRVVARDRCTAAESRKPADLVLIVEGPVRLMGDSIAVGGEFLFRRVEPHGLGDVHWEGPKGERFTDVQVEAVDV
jgi:hypothetical protein